MLVTAFWNTLEVLHCLGTLVTSGRGGGRGERGGGEGRGRGEGGRGRGEGGGGRGRGEGGDVGGGEGTRGRDTYMYSGTDSG